MLRTSYEELIWCNNYPNVHIHNFNKLGIFIWGWFFPLSILNENNKFRTAHNAEK